MRLNLYTTDNAHISQVILNSSADAGITLSATPTLYWVLMPIPPYLVSEDILASMEIINFNPDDSPTGRIYFSHFIMLALDFP